jgi:hypothetical protein
VVVVALFPNARGCLGLLVVGKVSDLSIVNSKEFVRSLNDRFTIWWQSYLPSLKTSHISTLNTASEANIAWSAMRAAAWACWLLEKFLISAS